MKDKLMNGVKNIISEKKHWKTASKNFKDHDLILEMNEMLHVSNLMYWISKI
jgi:hypothetical protein